MKKCHFIFLCLLIFGGTQGVGQPNYYYSKTYSTVIFNNPNQIKKTIEVIENEDTSYVSVGGGFYVFLLKTNANGDLLWGRDYSGTYGIGNSVKKTDDGGYIIVGQTRSFNPGSCSNPAQCSGVLVIKTDSVGNVQWSRTCYGSTTTSNNQSQAYDVEIVDNGYMIVGESSAFTPLTPPNCYMESTISIMLDLNGNLLWTKNYPCYKGGAVSLIKLSDNSFMIATHGYHFVKLDSVGNVINCFLMDFPCGDPPYINQMISASDGGFLLVGTYYGPLVLSQGCLYVAKTDSLGILEWSKAIGNGTNISQGWGVARDLDNSYIVAGFLYDSLFNKMLVLKLDTLGNVVWVNSASFNNQNIAFSILPLNDGYLAAGISGLSDVLVKLDGVGMFACNNIPVVVSDTNVYVPRYVTGSYAIDITSYVLFNNPGAGIIASSSLILESVFCETMFKNLTIEKILSPNTLPAGTSLYPSFSVRNIGTDTIFNFDLWYTYDPEGGAPSVSSTIENWNDTLLPGQQATITFANSLIVDAGVGDFCVYTDVFNDIDTSNNTFCDSISGFTGIADQDPYDRGFLLFPNPCNGVVTVRGEGILVIYDLLGKILQRQLVSDEDITLDLPAGCYLYTFGERKGKLLVL